MFRLLLDTALKTVTYRWQVIKIVETLVHRQIRFIPIKEGIEFDDQQDLRTKVMIAAGSYVVFQHQSGRSPSSSNSAPEVPPTLRTLLSDWNNRFPVSSDQRLLQ